MYAYLFASTYICSRTARFKLPLDDAYRRLDHVSWFVVGPHKEFGEQKDDLTLARTGDLLCVRQMR